MAKDNYGWLITWPAPHSTQPNAIVIDPTQGDVALRAVQSRGARLVAIWATHHHHDHTDGIASLVDTTPHKVAVVAGQMDVRARRIPRATVGLAHKELWSFGEWQMQALHVPGHTLGATAYYVASQRAVFVGDTLFAAGCGRMFEGTPEMMWASLCLLRALPQDTSIFCGHEYTLKNLRFATSLQTDAQAARAALARACAQRAAHRATVPTLLADEWTYNPFLRADDESMQRCMGTVDAVSTFASLRSARDGFIG